MHAILYAVNYSKVHREIEENLIGKTGATAHVLPTEQLLFFKGQFTYN